MRKDLRALLFTVAGVVIAALILWWIASAAGVLDKETPPLDGSRRFGPAAADPPRRIQLGEISGSRLEIVGIQDETRHLRPQA